MRYQNEAGEYIDCVTVFPGVDKSVSTLVLKSDEERTIFRSSLYLDVDFPNTTSRIIFDIKTWATSLWVSPSGNHYLSGIHGEVWEQGPQDFETTKPAEVTLHGIWGNSDTDIVVVGDNGTVLRKIGNVWNDISIDTDEPIFSVHGLADGFLAAVGKRGGFHLWNGSSWAAVQLETNVDFRGVWVGSKKEIYICGDRGVCFLYRDDKLIQLPAGTKDYTNVQAFQNNVYFGAGDLGVDVLKDGAVVEFQPKAGAIRLNASDKFLWACNTNKIYRFDGSGWLLSTFV